MNKNMVYVAVLACLCVLAGVVVGAVIVKKASSPWPCPERPNFSERAESFMRHGPGEWGEKHFGRPGHGMRGKAGGGEHLLDMLITKLDLNKDQQVKVKAILEKARQEIDQVGKNVRRAITEIKEKGDKDIMDILTSEQQEKFKALLEEFKAKKHGHNAPEKACGPMEERGQCPGGELPPPQDE